VAVVAVPYLGSLAEQRVRLVEEEDRAAFLGGVEDAPEVLLGLADVLAHDLAQVDAVEIEAQFSGEDFRGHCLPGPAGPGEKGADADPSLAPGRKAPPLVHADAVPDVDGDLPENRSLRLGEDEVVPARAWLDALREIVEAWPRLHAAGVPERVAVDVTFARDGIGGRRRDRLRPEVEVRDDLLDAAVQGG